MLVVVKDLRAMSGGFEGAAIKGGVTVAVKSGGSVLRKLWPDTSRLSTEVSGDTLADAARTGLRS